MRAQHKRKKNEEKKLHLDVKTWADARVQWNNLFYIYNYNRLPSESVVVFGPAETASKSPFSIIYSVYVHGCESFSIQAETGNDRSDKNSGAYELNLKKIGLLGFFCGFSCILAALIRNSHYALNMCALFTFI